MTVIRDLDSHAEAMVTPAELAAYWRVDVRTVYYYIQKGTLAAVRVGRQWRVRIECARAFGRIEPVEFAPLGSVRSEN